MDSSSSSSSKLCFEHQRAIDILVKSASYLQLHTDSICTACRYLHHFNDYLINNPPTNEANKYDIGVVVATALYIATKTKENHTQLSELISSVHFHLKNYDKDINYDSYQLLPKDANYWKLRDSVTYFELLMLRILQFDLIIDLPHKYLIFYLKSLNDWILVSDQESSIIEQIFLMSWSILNDYYCYNPKSLEWCAHHTALAAIEIALESLAKTIKKVLLPNNKNRQDGGNQTNVAWYSNFDQKLKHDLIERIINQMFEVYEKKYVKRNDLHLKVKTCHVMKKHDVKHRQ